MSKPAGLGAVIALGLGVGGITFVGMCFLPTAVNTFSLKLLSLAGSVAYAGHILHYLAVGQTITTKADKYNLVERDLRPDRANYLSLLPKEIWNSVSAKASRAEGYRTTVTLNRRGTFMENLQRGLDLSRSDKAWVFILGAAVFVMLILSRYVHFGLVAIWTYAWSLFK